MAQKKFLIDGGFQVNDDSIISANLEMQGHIIPSVDSDGFSGYDLGSPDFKWRDLYLSKGSLYIDGQKVIESNAGTIVVQADIDQSLLTKTRGAGVMTLQSPNPIAIAGTLQMGAGKRITSADALAVVFGDKIDMDANQIINVANPTQAQHVATKDYVDGAVSDILNGAPAALDTLNELADALGNDANFASTITNSLALKATTVYVDAQDATILAAAKSYADNLSSGQGTDLSTTNSRVTTAEADIVALESDMTAAQADIVTNADAIAANASAILAVNTYADNAASNAQSGATAAAATYTDTTVSAEADLRAQGDAVLQEQIDNIINNVDPAALDSLGEIVVAFQSADSDLQNTLTTLASNSESERLAIQTAMETYTDTAEADARAYTDSREAAITTSYENYADAAESDAKAYTDTRESAITSAYTLYADAAEAAAIAAAAADASSKVSVESTARTNADAALQSQIDFIVSNTDADALDSLTEIVAAFQAADSSLDGAISALGSAATTAHNDLDDAIVAESAARVSGDASTLVSAQSYTDSAIATLGSSVSSLSADVSSMTTDEVAEGSTNLYFTDARAQSAVAGNISSAVSAEATLRSAGDSSTLSSANAYTDSAVTALVGGASAAFDTLVEIQNAMATDAELTAAIAGLTNVATADKWATARTLSLSGDVSGSVAFDGSSNASISVTVADDSHNHVISNVDGLQAALDGKLNVSGNAVSASKLSSAKTIELGGDVSGSVAFDGSSNVTITATVADDSHNHVISNVDGLQAALDTKAAEAVTLTAGTGLTGGGNLTANRTFNVGAGYGISVAADSVAVNTATLDARYVQPADLTHFHSDVQTITSGQATTNASSSVSLTFSELAGAVHYVVYMNRVLLRPSEYSVSGTTVSIVAGVLATSDDIEVTGAKLV